MSKFKLITLTLLILLIATPSFAQFNGGDGESEETAYEINTATQLLYLADNSGFYDDYFILTDDISLSASSFTSAIIAPDTDIYNRGLNTGTGYQGTPFSGHFDGDGKTISSINISATSSEADYLGLFGKISGATIKDLNLDYVDITGFTHAIHSYVCFGGIVSLADSSTIENCSVGNLDIFGEQFVGGLVGWNIDTEISYCHTVGEIEGYSFIGGLIGLNGYDVFTRDEPGSVTDCYSQCSVYGYSVLGGLIGQNLKYLSASREITDCYATGAVTSDIGYGTLIGGLIGANGFYVEYDLPFSRLGLPITNCYATGTVTCTYTSTSGPGEIFATDYVGGLIGLNFQADIENCYATGNVIGKNYAGYYGGLVGYNTFYTDPGSIIEISSSYAIGNVSTGIYSQYIGGFIGLNKDEIYQSWATGRVTSGDDSKYIGGFAGENDTTINLCYATGSVTGGEDTVDIGGFVGVNDYYIYECFATGDVIGGEDSDNIGGFVGRNNHSISQAYNWGNVYGDSDIGGFVGYNYSECEHCYSIGEVTDTFEPFTDYMGGFAGDNAAYITQCFWDDQICTADDGIGHNGIYTPTLYGENTATMHTDTTFTDSPAEWDFVGESTNGDDDYWFMPTDFSSCPLLSGLAVDSITETGSGTAGSSTNPWGLSSHMDFEKLFDDDSFLGDYFVHLGNINLMGFEFPKAPIADTSSPYYFSGTPFTGSFDGNNYSIRYLKIDAGGSYACLALFGSVGSDGVVNDLSLTNVNLCDDAARMSGALVGFLQGSITNCNSAGSVNGFYYIGGLVGIADSSGTITDSHSSCTVSEARTEAGGLVGMNYGSLNNCYATGDIIAMSTHYATILGGLVGYNVGNIDQCYATGNLQSNDYHMNAVGGLVGANLIYSTYTGTITDSYATGDINATNQSSYIGGLVGGNGYASSKGGNVYNCYATGDITGSSLVGGLIGSNGVPTPTYVNGGHIANCYALGNVYGSTKIGGLVGGNRNARIEFCYSVGQVDGSSGLGGLAAVNSIGAISQCFWDTETSGLATSAGGTPKTTTQMQTQSTFTDAGWDFTDDGNDIVWFMPTDIDDSYPLLNSLIVDSLTGTTGDGDAGSAENPWGIASPMDFLELIGDYNYWNSGDNYILLGNINLFGFKFSDAPISPSDSPTAFSGTAFTGILDGNFYSISNLNIVGDGSYSCLGLFGKVADTGNVKNLNISDVNIDDEDAIWCGALAGISFGNITNCNSSGTISTDDYTGGLVGGNFGPVNTSYSSVEVTGDQYVGGLIGTNGDASNDGGDINNCYAHGDVDGDSYIGGFSGQNKTAVIDDSYSVGYVSGSSNLGGLVATNSGGTISNSFWDITINSHLSSGNGTEKTTAQMQTQSTYTDAGWDFEGETTNGYYDFWKELIGSVYPTLAWQE